LIPVYGWQQNIYFLPYKVPCLPQIYNIYLAQAQVYTDVTAGEKFKLRVQTPLYKLQYLEKEN
jgi:hypothetical protein